MDDSMLDMMFRDALVGLETGRLMPWDRELLSHAPLPSSVIDPYTAKEVPDVKASMELTFSAMTVWIEEAKKVSYFSKRFVQLSRMVMNGVTMMGRGLVTLHARGESPDGAPMSVQDLIGVASYHFRKSYLGVLQTAATRPDVSERLLMNQIGWNNTLMRLFRTREKLAEPVKIQTGETKPAEIAGAEPAPSLPAAEGQSITAVSPMREPAAYAAARAFSSYEKTSGPKRPSKKTAALPCAARSENGSPITDHEVPDGKEGPEAVPQISLSVISEEENGPEAGISGTAEKPETVPGSPAEKDAAEPEGTEPAADPGSADRFEGSAVFSFDRYLYKFLSEKASGILKRTGGGCTGPPGT